MTAIIRPRPDLQIAFFARLQELKKDLLLDALLDVVAGLDVAVLDDQVRRFVPVESRRRMYRWGVRAELVFALPCVLDARPSPVLKDSPAAREFGDELRSRLEV